MTTATIECIGTACDLAALAVKLQARQQGINAAARQRAQRPAFFGPDNSAHLDHADRMNRHALHTVTRALCLFPAANG